jgi:hypothetical protein
LDSGSEVNKDGSLLKALNEMRASSVNEIKIFHRDLENAASKHYSSSIEDLSVVDDAQSSDLPPLKFDEFHSEGEYPLPIN